MPACQVCKNPKRDTLDRMLLEGVSTRDAAGTVGSSKSAVDRHRRNCLPRILAPSREKSEKNSQSRPASQAAPFDEIASADDLRRHIAGLLADVQGILDAAKERGDNRIALTAVKELRETLLSIGKLAGWIQTGSTVTIDARSQSMHVYGSMGEAALRAMAGWSDDETAAAVAFIDSRRKAIPALVSVTDNRELSGA